jgi:hypothetical protein
MAPQPPLLRRRFRITIDVETTLDPASPDRAPHLWEGAHYQQALIHGLQADPAVLRQFLRALAVDALKPASRLLEAEYGWGRASDQQLLQPVIAKLEPAAQAYFTEELEDGARVYYVECYQAAVKQFGMIELDEQKNGG